MNILDLKLLSNHISSQINKGLRVALLGKVSHQSARTWMLTPATYKGDDLRGDVEDPSFDFRRRCEHGIDYIRIVEHDSPWDLDQE